MSATRLKIARLDMGLSLAEAAKRMGVSVETLARAERSQGIPQPRNAKRIADFYQARVTELWPVEDVPELRRAG